MVTRDDSHEIPPWDCDDDLLDAVRTDGRARWRVEVWPGVEVVLGRGSRVIQECHLEACRADGVPVRRRRGGGCAVVLDPGNLVISAVVQVPGLGNVRRLFDHFTAWVIEGLDSVGVAGVRRRDVCDLCLAERKIGGATLYRAKGLVYYSTTLLVAPDLSLMERYLPHPPREPAYRRGRTHRAFVTTLQCDFDVSARELAEQLLDSLPHPM